MSFPEEPLNDDVEDETSAAGAPGAMAGSQGQYFAQQPMRDFIPPPLSPDEAMISGGRKYVAYTVKLPSEQLAALQSIWLELKRLYGAHSPDKSGMIQQAIEHWLKRWDGPERNALLQDLLEIRQDTRRRQYRK